MKRGLTIFLQLVIILIGIGALALMLWEPQTEGVNVHATQFEIYFQDPFLAYIYIGAIPFFIALYQVFTLLVHIGKNNVFSPASVRALRNIKYCALAIVAFIAGAEAFIIINMAGSDDIAGGVAMGIFISFASIVIATVAAVFEKLLQKAVDMQAENDLTV